MKKRTDVPSLVDIRCCSKKTLIYVYIAAVAFCVLLGGTVVHELLLKARHHRISGIEASLLYEALLSGKNSTQNSTNATEVDTDWTVDWDKARTPKELENEKFAKNDIILEAKTHEGGYGARFSLVPYQVFNETMDVDIVTFRVDFKVIEGRVWLNMVFVEIFELDDSARGVPFGGYLYQNRLTMIENRTIDMPISKKMITTWMSEPDAKINFRIELEFGMFGQVHAVLVKPPVMIFTRVPRPKCSEFTCCLASQTHLIPKDSIVYEKLLYPHGFRNQRCFECSKVPRSFSPATLDNFNHVLHETLTPEEIPAQIQLGKCRGAEYSSLEMMFYSSKTNDVVKRYVPHFAPESCDCIEDDEHIPPNYEEIELVENMKASMKIAFEKMHPDSKATTKAP